MDATERVDTVVKGTPKQLLIGGQWRDASGGGSFGVENPADGAVLCAVADATPADGVAALDAAVRAQEGWGGHPPRERGEILRRAYDLLMDRREDLAALMTAEMGKPLPEARTEIAYAAEFFRWFAEEAVRIDGGYAVAP
ncbi:MAG: aldehyde dehydrogenase family protein, partial [Geodermatophilaceae bacterium]